MSSSPITSLLTPSSSRAARPRNELPAMARTARRTYASQRPTPNLSMNKLGNNRGLMIASLLGVPALAYFLIPSRPKSVSQAATRRPNLDPAAEKRARNETGSDSGRGTDPVHPEDKDPENFKPAFGQVHQQKRVDTPPDGRHHQALHDRARGQE
ncbi:hypothetical protein F5B17DRAFT_232770 [Nemania serpens]|nr:hypothetical protein F5B17DRAFT_232770 [Nemania serpens]